MFYRTFRLPAEPRTVVLHRAKKGFGFILRGAKATSPLMELMPSDKCPALQYLDDVDPGGVADLAGLRKGDFLLEINDEDVSTASHEHVVDLIRRSGDLVSMTVISMGAGSPNSFVIGLPSSKSTAALPAGINQPPPSRMCATLPRKLPNLQANGPPLPPRRDPKTTLSVGRARAKSMVAGLENGSEQSLNSAEQDNNIPDKSNSAESLNRVEINSNTGTPTALRTASIRARPTSSRITAAELEELFQRQHDTDMMTTSHFQSYDSTPGSTSSPNKSKGTKVYASVAEMKRAKNGKSSTKVRFLSNLLRTNSDAANSQGELHRNFHSTPNLARSPPPHQPNQRSHHSQENVAQLSGRAPFRPPPSHPPPPPPVGQLVMVDTSRASKSEYDVVRDNSVVGGNAQVESSFRPAANAKLYASPIDIKPVGFRSRSLPSHSARPHVRKSQSLRTPATGPVVRHDPQQPTSFFGNSGGNGNQYAQPINLLRSNSNEAKRRDEVLKGSNNQPPIIPEPDYSLSESSAGESDNENGTSRNNHVVRLRVTQQPVTQPQQMQQAETSGSSSGSGSMPHSFSVDEIQKVRTSLKSSKSYPNDFSAKKKVSIIAPEDEDCDNSSSGVSSDQEIPQRQNTHGEERNLARHAVSLAQLPPPVENAEESSLVLPPPPEFEVVAHQGAPVADTVVLAPPPQFSDFSRHQHANRVRIVGAVPKNAQKSKQGRLHSQ